MKVLHTLLALAVLGCGAALAADAPLDATTRDFDQVHLRLEVEPKIREGTVEGTAALTFVALTDDFRRLRLHSEDTTVLVVTDRKGRKLGFSTEKGILGIDLAGPLATGDEETVTIVYRSKPTSGLWFHAPTKEHPHVPLSVYSQGQGTANRHWIPCYDEPDDRLTLSMYITIERPLRTVSNGMYLKEEYLADNRRRDYWKLDHRIPTYLITLAAGPYDYWVDEGEPYIEFWTFPGSMPAAKHALRNTRRMLELFEKITGVEYPYERYAQVFVWDFLYGGMENATATTLNMRALHGPETEPNYSAESLVAHELAHQWFGDLITCRTWHHIWLNEGFATYFADLWFAESKGTEVFRLRRFRQTSGYLEGTRRPESLGLERAPRGDRPLELFGGKQYSRGAAILHLLRHEIGDRAFFAAIRGYAKKHADSAATTESFRRSVERAAGRDLGWFFEQWVYGAGYPRLLVSWEYEAAAKRVRVRVRQTQPEKGGQGLFRLSLPVVVYRPDGEIRATRVVFAREHEFTLTCPEPPVGLRVDPEEWLLAEVTISQSFAAWSHQARRGDPVGRIRALREVVRFGRRGEAVLIAALRDDPSWAGRREAAIQLGRLRGGTRACPALLDARADDDARVREEVWNAMGEVSYETLRESIEGEKHPHVRAAIARAAGRAHLPVSFDLLAGLLSEESHRETVRHGALDGLRILGDFRAVELARPYLEYRWGLGAQSRMRQAALDLILALDPDSRETRAIVIGLLVDPYFRMRSRAANACATYGIREAIPALTRARDHDRHGGVRHAARGALSKLAGKKGKGD